MPRVWGSWSATSGTGARYRVGLDYTLSGTTVTVDGYVFESAYSIYKNVTLTRTGRLSGTYSVAVSTAGGVVSLGRGGSFSGSRGSSVTVGGSVTNILHGLTCSVSVSIPIPAVAPSKPSRPTISNVSASGLRGNLASAPANGGASITAYGWQCEGGPSTDDGTRNWTVTGLDADTSYRVRVRARNSVGWGPWSDWSASARTSPLAPNAPTGLTVSRNSDTSQALSWTRNVASGRPYGSQRIQRRHSGPGIPATEWATIVNNLSATATSYTDTSTVAARRYDYRIVAVNAGGTGTSSHASINTAPSAPSSVVATKDGNNIRLAITLTATYAGVGQMVVQHSANGGAWATLATVAAAGSYVHLSPDPAQTHRYRVASRADLGNALTGPYSAPSNTVQLQAPPLAPTNLAPSGTVVDASGAVRLSWRHNPVDTSPQSARQIRYRVAGATSWTTLTAATSSVQYQDVTAFSNGNNYEWQVRTRGDDPGWGPYSATATFTASSAPTVAITAPLGIVEASSVVAGWSYYDAEGTAQSRAEVNLTSDGESVEFRTVNGSASTLPLNTALINGREYTLRVRVRDGSGLWSGWDSSTFTVNFAAPPAPALAVDWDRERGAAILNIDNPTDLATFEWAGTPGESASIKRINGIETARNLMPNPSFEYPNLTNTTSGIHSTFARSTAHTPPGGRWGLQCSVTEESTLWNSRIQLPSTDQVEEEGGQWVALSFAARRSTAPALIGARMQVVGPGWTEYQWHDFSWSPWQRYTFAWEVPPGTTSLIPHIQVANGDLSALPGNYNLDTVVLAVSDSEPQALLAVQEYFDGDTKNQAPATSNDILRRVDGGEWELIATGVPLNATVLDHTPPLKGLVEYKVRAWSDLPSSTDGAEVELVITDHTPPAYLGGGAGFSIVVPLAYNPEHEYEIGIHEKVLHRFAGRELPVQAAGKSRGRIFNFTGALYTPEDTRKIMDELANMAGIHLLRTPDGDTIYGSLGRPMLTRMPGGVGWEVAFTMTEVDHRVTVAT